MSNSSLKPTTLYPDITEEPTTYTETVKETAGRTTVPGQDEFNTLLYPMGVVAAVVVLIIMMIIVCFIYRSHRRSRLNILRMKNRKRPAAISMELVDSDQNSNAALHGVSQPLYGQPRSMASFRRVTEEPQYANTGINAGELLLATSEPSTNTDPVSTPNNDSIQIVIDKVDSGSSCSKTQDYDIPKDPRPVNSSYDCPEPINADSATKAKSMANVSDKCVENIVVEKPLKEQKMENFMDYSKLFQCPPPPCNSNVKYVNTQGLTNCPTLGESTVRNQEHRYVNVAAGAVCRRGYSTSVLPRSYDESEYPQDAKLNKWVSDELYIPMDVYSQTNPHYVNTITGRTCLNSNNTYVCLQEDDYKNMILRFRNDGNDKTHTENIVQDDKSREFEPPTPHMYANTEHSYDQEYVTPGAYDQDDIEYEDCNMTGAADDVYIYANQARS